MGILVEIIGRGRIEIVGGGQPQDAVLVAAFGLAVPGPFEPGRDQPAVMIERQRFSFGEGLAAFVAEWSGGDVSAGEWRRMRRSGAVGPMFNGRFVWAGDARFGAALGEGALARPVKLMDRWETVEQYATYD